MFGMRPVPSAVVAGADTRVGRLPPSTLYMRVLALKAGWLPVRSKYRGLVGRWADTSPTCRLYDTERPPPRTTVHATWLRITGRPGSLAASSGDGVAPAAMR
ncbi:hypothetical protein MDOR_07430 [Mycolicibacterium doricum]|uniref:Uncharacterized protein n=1 Tax=Mycolicibacterium doricum TaxID=126673 RepID=A0A7I7VMU8_9MYCO|nr:hypothetical protein MDOR_07430 [Mycolicibacterium doricum]